MESKTQVVLKTGTLKSGLWSAITLGWRYRKDVLFRVFNIMVIQFHICGKAETTVKQVSLSPKLVAPLEYKLNDFKVGRGKRKGTSLLLRACGEEEHV